LDPALSAVQAGDKVVLIKDPHVDTSSVQSAVDGFVTQGVEVEWRRELRNSEATTKAILPVREGLQDLDAVTVFEKYAQKLEGEMSGAVYDILLRSGRKALQNATSAGLVQNNVNGKDVVFNEVILENFGPYKTQTTYPLMSRGLVLLKAQSFDGTGSAPWKYTISVFECARVYPRGGK
jgi:hypothetical protein